MKAVTDFDVDLSRLDEVRAAKRVGAVQQESSVGQIHRMQRHQAAFAKAFAKRDIKSCMTRQVIRSIAFQKARSITNVPREITA